MTQPKFQMTVLFHEVGGLTIGAPVAVSGVNVGTVADIDFIENDESGRNVAVVLNIYKKYENQLKKSYRYMIKTEGILGEKFVDINIRDDFRRPDLKTPVIGEDPIDIQNLAVTFGESAEALSETSDLINSMFIEMQRIGMTTKRLLNRIEQRVIEGNLFKVF
ncbi:MAG: hypothetical protein COV48_06570 [Elusimicrobia bacterium CG11_big_fil_rev_8_21_14_0_20_64_6]|nr:MAG: hypothetical protein COV48_06570 [Elusimicrobia bacterium CG11_big_fil_rev_8_21_14_0_20_64_6]